ncbi:MAG: histidine kinase, partial [Melioribacteraceae bacterium]|nr:histidine kinase [Melioribacteraceae bacterium]
FISLGLLIFAVDRIRTRQLNKKNKIEEERKLKQQAAIEKAKSDERQRVRQKTAADFHDELGHMLTKITLFTEMAKRSVKDNIGAQKYLKGVGDNASQLSSGMKDLIWTLDSNKDSLYDALIRIKDFGEVLFEHSSIAFGTTGFPEDLNKIKISMDMRRHLILIFKEVMNNCLKYSKCNNAEFAVILGDDNIQIIFTDDGKGFDIDSIKLGNGLKNIKMRAQNMGAELKILSELGKTEVIISLNI